MTHHDDRPTVRILGTHGIPAAYGGFETAAENVALHLRDHGWRVVVYCQRPGRGPVTNDVWRGIERVHVPIDRDGWLGTSHFDLVSIRHAIRHRDVCLTFGYNTAVFNVLQRLRGIKNVINMDGIEWSRSRWGPFKQAILWTNERIACFVGNDLIADHPAIERYLRHEGEGVEDLDDHLRRPHGDRRSHLRGRRPRSQPRRVRHADLPPDPRELDPRAGDGLLGPPSRNEAGGARHLHDR